MNDHDSIVMLYVPVDGHENAQRIARILLEQKIVACINIVPSVTSMYWWQGILACDQEVIMWCKTTAAHSDQVEQTIKAHHPYKVVCVARINAQVNQEFRDFVHHATQ